MRECFNEKSKVYDNVNNSITHLKKITYTQTGKRESEPYTFIVKL